MKSRVGSLLKLSAAATALSFALGSAPVFAADNGDVIVVTGSRIARPELKAAVPIEVVSAQSISATGTTNIQDALKDLPSVGQGIDRASSNFSNTGNAEATVNLRNLGSSRTLVLIDGRRSVGIPGSSATDLNNIPTDLIDHVEVVTGGASAIYGSDAVAGVVNIILKNKFKGLELHAQNMESDKGDAQNRLFTATGGTDFGGGRGHIVVHFGFNTDSGLRSADRSFSAKDNPNRSSFAAQGLFSVAPDGSFSAGNGATYTFDGTNALKLYQGANTDGYNRAAQRYLSLPVDRYQAATMGDYEFSPAADAYYEFSYTRTNSRASLEALAVGNTGPGAVTNFDGTPYAGIPITSPYVPAAIAQAAIANGVNVIQFRRRSVDIFSRSNTNNRDFWRAVLGLKGDIGAGWHYDLSYEHSQDRDHTYAGAILTGNYGAALSNSVVNGQVVCSDPAARAAGCVPINIFGFNTVTPAAAAWLQTDPGNIINPLTGLPLGTQKGAKVTYDYLAHVKQDVVSLGLNGHLFNLPGGPVGVALGAEYRFESSSEVFDPYTQSGTSSGNQISNTIGSFNTKEAFVEVNAPLLKDVTLIKELSLEGAARYADYNTVGGVWTYKFGGAYAPSRDIRFRAVFAQAVRAPNIGELFSAQSQTFPAINDPCDQGQGQGDGATLIALPAGCATIPGIANYLKTHSAFAYSTAQIQTTDGLLGGNPNLKPEKTDTLTIGAVITPSFFHNFSLTADYYTIKVKNAIGIIGQQVSVSQCFQTGNPLFCSNVIRDNNTGFITRVNALNLNVGSYLVSGLDVQAHYRSGLSFLEKGSKLDLTIFYNHKFKQQQTPFPGGPIQNELGQADCYSCGRLGTGFKDTFTFNTALELGALSFNYRVKYLGPVFDNLDGSVPTPTHIGAIFYHDIEGKVTIGDKRKIEIYGGVNNIFDTPPPLLGDTNPATWPGTATVADTYDTLGRMLYVGARVKF